MADGEYDIMGNPIVAPKPTPTRSTEVNPKPTPTPTAPAPAPTTEMAVKKFSVGDKVEVKEGGRKYRAAEVTSVDDTAKCLDVVYGDGEKECGIPLTLVRAPGPVVAASARPRPQAGSETTDVPSSSLPTK